MSPLTGTRTTTGTRTPPAPARTPAPHRHKHQHPHRHAGARPAETMSRPAATWPDRVGDTDWDAVRAGLDGYGCGLTGPLLTGDEAAAIAALYPDDARFRSTVNMARHRFGEGEYRYFAHPYPEAVTALKQALTRSCCRSPATGGAASAAQRRGRTAWRTGWRRATPRGSGNPRRSCCATGLGTGTPCTATCTATWCSPCRS